MHRVATRPAAGYLNFFAPHSMVRRFRLIKTGKQGIWAMKGINTPGQALDSGGIASFSAPRDGVSHLAFPALSPERNLPAGSFPLAPLGNDKTLLV